MNYVVQSEYLPEDQEVEAEVFRAKLQVLIYYYRVCGYVLTKNYTGMTKTSVMFYEVPCM